MQHDTENPKIYSGPLVAATLALLLAFFTLMVSHHISRLTKELDKIIHSYGHWIPGSTGSGPDGSIGSYTGKETLAIAVWLVSWLIFHCLWRRQDLSLKVWTRLFVVGLLAITLGFFHPISDPIVLFIADLLGIY
ncbi:MULTISPECIES: hypothetical protein [Methylomonas]|uniref:hypothetical protein n=1 Tax=Methylomonas TaxID=416 RepID=UPI001231B38A|nr:hypothetical protein [Methylomonas rhizoryzae]